MTTTLPQRLESKLCKSVQQDVNGCWNWTGHIQEGGYAQIYSGTWAHRWAYEYFVGAIEAGLHIDHLCRNRACVNPTHLEPVTPKVNVLRGIGLSAVNAAKTHCLNGHELSGENLWTRTTKTGRTIRTCKECQRVRWRRWHSLGRRNK